MDAAVLALNDAESTKSQVDGFVICKAPRALPRTGTDEAMGQLLGLNPAFGSTLEYAAGLLSVHFASMAIQAGLASTVLLTFGSAARSSKTQFGKTIGGGEDWVLPHGLIHIAGLAALAVRRHMALYGTTEEQIGGVAIAQRQWAALNDRAVLRDRPLTLDDYLAERYVVEPLRRSDLTVVTDGGVALVLTGVDAVAAFPRPPVYVHATAQQAAFRGDQNPDRLMRPRIRDMPDHLYDQVGIGPGDVDVAYLQDATSVWVLQLLELYGFCKPGEGGPFLLDGHSRPGSSLPVNTGGGQLAESYMSNWLNTYEAVAQLRGDCGPRQVPGAAVAFGSKPTTSGKAQRRYSRRSGSCERLRPPAARRRACSKRPVLGGPEAGPAPAPEMWPVPVPAVPSVPAVPRVLASDHEWSEVAPRRTVYSLATYRRAFDKRFEAHLPYTVAYVELDEGPRMVGMLEKINPDIVACSLTGFGSEVSYADRPAYDIVVEALAVVMSLTGPIGGPSVRAGVPIRDIVAGLYAVIGILLGLEHRRAHGGGTHVDISMLDWQISLLSYLAQYSLLSGEVAQHQGSGHVGNAMYDSFATAGGSEIVMNAGNDDKFQALFEVLRRPDIASDPRFAHRRERLTNRTALEKLIREETQRRAERELYDALSAAGVPCAPINTIDRALRDPQVRFRDIIVRVPHRSGGTYLGLGSPVKNDDSVGGRFLSAPARGMDTVAPLGELGYDEGDIDRLSRDAASTRSDPGDGLAVRPSTTKRPI